MESNKCKAKRLGYVLQRYSELTDRVEKIARALNYNTEDLVKDMKAVINYIDELEEN